MKGRKGMEAGLSLVLIMMAIIGLVLILIMTGIFSGGTERSEKQMKDANDSSDISCPTICFKCCNGLTNLDPKKGEYKNVPLVNPLSGKSQNQEVDNCDCSC